MNVIKDEKKIERERERNTITRRSAIIDLEFYRERGFACGVHFLIQMQREGE
jgi:hypothetical protein